MPPPSVASDEPASRIAVTSARILLETQAIHFCDDPPFVLTSGRRSPVYVDCRRLISFPRGRAALMDMAVRRLQDDAGFEAFDAVAGGETAGIPFAAWIAERLGLPMLYVRKKAKGFGRNAQIEGTFEPGARVLLVEDLMTDGGSKVVFLKALRDAGARVGHCFVVFRYGLATGSADIMASQGVVVTALVTWRDVLAVAEAEARLPAGAVATVRAFLADPEGWSARHGGPDGGPDGGKDAGIAV